jgi:hypothetical protein
VFGLQGLDLIWFGDSISEHFLGTDTGVPSPKTTVPVWEQHYSKYRSACFSLAHDRTVGLLWRVINGEAPEARKTYSSPCTIHSFSLSWARMHTCVCACALLAQLHHWV